MLETFNAITRSNWPESFAIKCHDAIYSDFCLENGTNSIRVHCSEDMGKLSTEDTTTTARDMVVSKVMTEVGLSDTTDSDEEDSQPSPTTISQTQDSSPVVTENVDLMLSTFIVTIKEELDLTFKSSKSNTVTPSVPLIINQTAAARESTQIPTGDDSIQNNTDQISLNENGLKSSGTSDSVNSNIEYVPKLNEPTFSEAEIFLIFGATISLCLFLLCCLCILCLRKW